MLKDKN